MDFASRVRAIVPLGHCCIAFMAFNIPTTKHAEGHVKRCLGVLPWAAGFPPAARLGEPLAGTATS